MSIRQAQSGLGVAIGGGAGGGILYPDSASRPFNSNNARNDWANNNRSDLIKDTTVVNVGGNQWYLWTGESNPDTVSSSLWMDANLIVQGEQGQQGDAGVDVTTATIDNNGDLIVTLSDGTDINTGRAKGEDGDLVYQLLPISDYGNFFDAEWASLGTNIYGVTGDGSEFSNAPFTTVSGQQYSFEVLLVNEANQYSMRITLMEAGENSGRDAILAGIDKASAEADGWRVYAFTSDPGHTDPADGFVLKQGSSISATDSQGANVPILGYRGPDNFVVGPYDGSKLVIISAKDNAYVSRENGEIKKIILKGETVDSIVAGSNITVDNSNPSRPIISASPSSGGSGLPDNGVIDNLTASFETLAVGKWYVDGWENSSNLPDWDSPDRVASLTVFGGYDGDANGAYWNLVSHRKGVYAAAKSSGVTSDWLRLDNATQVITSSSPLEVRKTGGSDHDAVAVTDTGVLVFGTASPEITETQFRSAQRRFSADVRNSDNTGQSLEQLAYISDITALEGSAIQWQRVMEAEPVASGTYILEATDSQTGQVVKSNDNDLLVLTYVSSEEYVYTLPLGMVRERKERTGQDYDFYSSTVQWVASENHFVIEVSESANQKSFDFSINGANRIELDQQIIKQGAKEGYSPWTRGNVLNVSASELSKTIDVMAQPFVPDADGVNTLQINLPSKGDFEQYYHIPGINDQQAADNDLPHIEGFELVVFMDHFENGNNDHKVILRSDADWLPMYGDQSINHYDGIYLLRKSGDKSTPHRSVFKFRKLIQGATTGPWDGYTLVSQDANLWNEIGSTYAQPATVENSQNTFVLTDDTGNHFTVIKRMQPVYATVELSKYQLIKLSSDSDASAGDFPEVVAGTVGEVASGFALAFDDANDTLANTAIYQIASGELELSTTGAAVGDSIYVDETTGVITLDVSPYPCGWVVNGGVVLDIDMYNASVLSGGGLTQQDLIDFGRGIAVPEAVEVSGGNTYQQTEAVAHFTTIGTDINDVIIEIDADLLESETIITVPSDSQVTTKAFDVVQVAGQGTSRSIKAGETWRVRMKYDQTGGTNTWFWEKVVTGGGGIVYGLSGRNDIIEDPSIKAFAYVEGMPYHLLFETPATADQSAKARLADTFPASKTFRFTPLAERTYQGVVAATSNEAGVPTLGQYSDIPLYCFEPNAVVSRDQVGFINWPSTVQIDVSEGFYVYGTVSGWAGGADRNGTTAVYVGRNADNPKGGGGKIGIALVADRLTILTGNGAEDADNATGSQFNKESGVAHFYRYAFYVDRAGNMLYFVQDLNDGTTHQGSTTANLASLNTDSRLYVAYDREGANTSTIAVGETTLVMNNEGLGEERWNWRN